MKERPYRDIRLWRHCEDCGKYVGAMTDTEWECYKKNGVHSCDECAAENERLVEEAKKHAEEVTV